MIQGRLVILTIALCLAWAPFAAAAEQQHEITITVYLEPQSPAPATFSKDCLPAQVERSGVIPSSLSCELGTSHLEMSQQANNLLVTVVPE